MKCAQFSGPQPPFKAWGRRGASGSCLHRLWRDGAGPGRLPAMCNLYTITSPQKALEELFGTAGPPVNVAPTPAIWPRDRAPIVRLGRDGGRELVLASWGLIPFWAKDDKIASKAFNARGETLQEKPSFREAFKRRRCLVPANAYFEWEGEKGRKTVVEFSVKDQPLFAMAGLWEVNAHVQRQPVESFTVITTEPNATAAAVHHRMPVVLAPQDWLAWLDRDTPSDVAQSLLRPCPDDWLQVARTGRGARDLRESAQASLF